MLALLVFLPVLGALIVTFFPSERLRFGVSALLWAALTAAAASLYADPQTLTFFLPHAVIRLIEAADILLLLYFLRQGFRFRSRPVVWLAALQLPLYLWALAVSPADGAPVLLDGLSRWMFIIINAVGGLIVLYAVQYMRYEAVDEVQKRRFVAFLMLFLSVMNALVVADSILLFFFLFETTTLASYLLIAFRDDALGRANALRALWMNQIGGAALLLGALVAAYAFGAGTFTALTQGHGGLLLGALVLLALAAPVKGASLPFDSWLLGAMVAPTPVSAILHSATMVKIAPFLLLKLAPALGGTLPGALLALFGALVFAGASYLALSRTAFKEILGYSTVALLGLMMGLAAVGTPQSMALAMALMLFHALSKALLFLAAGVLEKLHGLKDVEQMRGLVQRAPLSVAVVLFGFFTLTLPPFGLFMGKLFAIVSVAQLLDARPWLIVMLLGMAVGSALLVMLYFKVAAALLSAPSDVVERTHESMPPGFGIPMALLALLTVAAAGLYLADQQGGTLWLFAVPVALLGLVPLSLRALRGFDRVSPYRCGEKSEFDAATVYAAPSAATVRRLHWGFGLMLASVAVAGVLS